jgi:SET domain-containing protein
MMIVKSYVTPSKVQGLGVFAAEPIKKGSIVWRFDPKWDIVFSVEEVSNMTTERQEYIKKYAYLDNQGYILCSDDAKYLNHSSVPNVNSRAGIIEDIAIRDIDVGEELLVDYRNFDIEDKKNSCLYEILPNA